MNLKARIDKIKYTIYHRRYVRLFEKQLLSKTKNSLRILLHDLDKIPLILIFGSKASKIHRKISRHHDRAKTEKDYLEMIIDWESARFTKPDKPLNARQTLEKFYPHLKNEIEPLLNKLYL